MPIIIYRSFSSVPNGVPKVPNSPSLPWIFRVSGIDRNGSRPKGRGKSLDLKGEDLGAVKDSTYLLYRERTWAQ